MKNIVVYVLMYIASCSFFPENGSYYNILLALYLYLLVLVWFSPLNRWSVSKNLNTSVPFWILSQKKKENWPD